jgi:hypothetical protein
VRERPEDPEPELDHIDRPAARRVIESALASTPHGRTLYPSECVELLETFGIASLRGPVKAGDSGGSRRLTATAWQDPVFGPLLTCKRDGEGSGDEGGVMTLLVPAGVAELGEIARVVLAEGRVNTVVSDSLADLLARIAALIDELPQLTSLCVHLSLDAGGSVRVLGSDGQVAPAQRKDPYLRRLRRAPVE